jgi:catechol 2,3-dioxygenase-like lactoylglutathione lyase family enzyme
MITAHNHTGITVNNLERSIDFYTNTLGMKLERQFEVDGPGISTIVALPGAHLRIAFVCVGSFRLELIEYLAPQGGKVDMATNNIGSAHVAFTTDDLDTTYEELKAKGVHFKGAPMRSRPDRPRVAYLLDPDGYTLEIVSP